MNAAKFLLVGTGQKTGSSVLQKVKSTFANCRGVMRAANKIVGLFVLAAFSFNVVAQDAATKPLILVAMAPIYGLTQTLLVNTNIDLQLLPEEPRSMEAQRTVFTRQADRYAEQFAKADAVIGINKIWPGDPFYITARDFKIRVVDIDASKPWSHELPAISWLVITWAAG